MLDRFVLLIVVSLVFSNQTVLAQTVDASTQNATKKGDIDVQLPSVTPQEWMSTLSKRIVPASDVPQLTFRVLSAAPSARSSVPVGKSQSILIEPNLGHELPTSVVTPGGFARADFAIAKTTAALKNQKQDGLSTDTVISTEVAPSPKVIEFQPTFKSE